MLNKLIAHHRATVPYAYPLGPNRLRVVLRARSGTIQKASLMYGDRYGGADDYHINDMELVASGRHDDYFQGEMSLDPPRFRYAFFLDDGVSSGWLTEEGLSVDRPRRGFFQYPYINQADLLDVPDWLVDGVVYQIFPERFFNGDPQNDPPDVRPWSDERPTATSFYGGDLKGVIDRLSHLKQLGVNVLYLNPIFASPTNHKYDTTDYYRIDPHFGDERTFKTLVEQCHDAGIKVILDAVFNHCGHHFFAFKDVREKGADSEYADWFHIESFPVTTKPPNYETFANSIASMPKLRTENPKVRQYLLDVGRYWIETFDIDGWRIDVANEVDHAFWREFRQVVKAAKSTAYIVGEIWHESLPWLMGDQFDGVTNYPVRKACIDFFARGSIDASRFAKRLGDNLMAYPEPMLQASWNLLGSHDTERFMTLCGRDARKVALAVVFNLTWVGTPMVYYGEEIGMEGENDPDCRRPMIWDQSRWHQGLFDLHQRMIRLRLTHPALRRGKARIIMADPLSNVVAYQRGDGPKSMMIVLNNSPVGRGVALDMGNSSTTVIEQTGECRVDLADGRLSLKIGPYSAVVMGEGSR